MLALTVRSLPTSYPLLHSVPFFFFDSLCRLLEWVRSRETSQRSAYFINKEHFGERGQKEASKSNDFDASLFS